MPQRTKGRWNEGITESVGSVEFNAGDMQKLHPQLQDARRCHSHTKAPKFNKQGGLCGEDSLSSVALECTPSTRAISLPPYVGIEAYGFVTLTEN